MLTIHPKPLSTSSGLTFTIERGGAPAAFDVVFRALRDDPSFRSSFNEMLAGCPYEAFRWELPGLTSSMIDRPFECVVVESRELIRPAAPGAFEEHFADVSDGVAVFTNLGGDATLIVPNPIGPPSAYPHLAAFVRLAPAPQRDALWKAVAEAMRRRLSERPVWLSTAGAGVPWLHVRLDDRPKYYVHGPYRRLA